MPGSAGGPYLPLPGRRRSGRRLTCKGETGMEIDELAWLVGEWIDDWRVGEPGAATGGSESWRPGLDGTAEAPEPEVTCLRALATRAIVALR